MRPEGCVHVAFRLVNGNFDCTEAAARYGLGNGEM